MASPEIVSDGVQERLASRLEEAAQHEPSPVAILQPPVDGLDQLAARIDELAFADVITPTGWLCHAGDGRHHLGAHHAIGGVGNAKVTIGQERPTSWDERCGLLCGMVQLHGRFLYRIDRCRHMGPPLNVPRIDKMQRMVNPFQKRPAMKHVGIDGHKNQR